MSLRQEIVHRRLRVFGLKYNQITQIIDQVNSWIRNNGSEWTISRLKLMKVNYIQSLAHPEQKIEWSWIKTKNSVPSGVFKPIFELNNPKKILNSLMIYSDLISPKVTKKQWKKFIGSAHQEIDDSKYDLFVPVITDLSKPVRIMHSKERNVNTEDWYFPQSVGNYKFKVTHLDYSNVRAPNWYSDHGKTIPNNALNTVNSFSHFSVRRYMNKHYEIDTLPEWFLRSIRNNWRKIDEVMVAKDRQDHVGRISFIQEPGYKLRAIANPYPTFQTLLEPLKLFLMNTLRVLPEDHCHDHQAAREGIRSFLKNNPDINLSSIDLSDATNNIPLKPQIELVETLIGPSHPQLELFREVARGKWYIETPDGESSMSFNKGHPLGTGPSFGLFSLFHHYVARCAIAMTDEVPDAIDDFYRSLNSQKLSDGFVENYTIENNMNIKPYPYWIVGDDIVIANKYAENYIAIINGIYDVPISYDKCIFNSRVAEICSRVITETSIIPMYKWKVINDSSFLTVARDLGPKSMILFRPKQQAILRLIGGIPDTLGGPVSWNPYGKCLLQREAEFWKDANEFMDIVSTDSVYVRREEVHYQFLRDIKVILNFKKHSLFDKVHDEGIGTSVSTETSIVSENSDSPIDSLSRQRELLYAEFKFCIERGSSIGHSFKSAAILLNLRPHTVRFNDEEYDNHISDFTFPKVDPNKVREYDVFFEKLCTRYLPRLDEIK